MRWIVALIFLFIGLVVAISKLGQVPERWVMFIVLVALTLNWWIPRVLTRGTSERRVSPALPVVGGVTAIGGAILLYLDYGWAPAIAVALLYFGYIFIAQ